MRYRIAAGNHYHAMPPFSTLPWLGKREMARRVTFDKSCAYAAPAYNADDVNKLFGLSFGFGGVHHNSARFGWRWNEPAQRIDLVAYVYNAGQRNQDEQLRFPVVAQLPLGQAATCSITLVENNGTAAYLFEVDTVGQRWLEAFVACPLGLPSFGLTHGPYFGGELLAPHEMIIQLERV